VSNTKTEQGKVVLLDCGRASKATKGIPLLPLTEWGWPPFDRLLF